jgi:predicted AlkP superfamily phosphohydrolase/phosphomutase
VNLRGREPAGIIDAAAYTATCDELEGVLRACRDPRTGEAIVEHIERPGSTDPFSLGDSDADLIAVWRGSASAFVHPELGLVGPTPFRRTGGHTGRYGFAYLTGQGIEPGDGGIRSAFDVTPTIATLLHATHVPDLDGTSMLAARV